MRRIPAKPRATRPGGCDSLSTPWAKPTGRGTARAGRSTRMDSRNWPRKLDRPLHPPGRDVRCIVSVGMLTEGWDCNTVTHIIGLRPFMSQLLCEQVVGRGLRRASYEVDDEWASREEVAKVFGVPFEVIPFKANPPGPAPPRKDRKHVHAIAAKAAFEIKFPRVERYTRRSATGSRWTGRVFPSSSSIRPTFRRRSRSRA